MLVLVCGCVTTEPENETNYTTIEPVMVGDTTLNPPVVSPQVTSSQAQDVVLQFDENVVIKSFLLDGTAKSLSTEDHMRFNYTAVKLTEGVHRLTVVALDIAGNSVTGEANLTVDTAKPRLTTIEPGEYEVLSKDETDVRLVFSEEVTITSSQLDSEIITLSTDNNKEFTCFIDGLEYGKSYTIRVTAEDKAGNTLTIASPFSLRDIAQPQAVVGRQHAAARRIRHLPVARHADTGTLGEKFQPHPRPDRHVDAGRPVAARHAVAVSVLDDAVEPVVALGREDQPDVAPPGEGGDATVQCVGEQLPAETVQVAVPSHEREVEPGRREQQRGEGDHHQDFEQGVSPVVVHRSLRTNVGAVPTTAPVPFTPHLTALVRTPSSVGRFRRGLLRGARRAYLLGQGGRAADGEVRRKQGERLLAHAPDPGQLLGGLERPVGGAELDDPLRQRRPDPRQELELLLVRGVDVDLRHGCRGRRQRLAGEQRGERHGEDDACLHAGPPSD